MDKIKLICFFGPESTGKTVLAEKLAGYFNTEWVPEVAREIISTNDFTLEDIAIIGKAQTHRVVEKTRVANQVLICDTDVITTKIYSRHYLGSYPPVLDQLEKQIHYDHYFLFDVDVAWVADGMRDLSDARHQMFDVFKHELDLRSIRYTIVRGNYAEREEFVKREIQKMLR